MKAYSIDYTVNGRNYSSLVDARDVKSAKNKLARKHKVSRIKVTKVSVVGYF